ncbi:MAG: isoprenylcysteine carboxylmethyltransferase family protein [Dehalococcoidia bacterium]|jgi:protein-S-isoprenylcysteine O-methyltransferase
MDKFAGGFIIACFVVFYAYLFAAAFRQKRTVERVRYPFRIPALLLLFVIAVIIARAFPGTGIGDFFGHKPAWREALADFTVFCGFVLAVWARTVLGGNWSSRTVFKEGHELIERGPYRYVRHPMYSGMLLALAGLAIWVAHVGIIVIFAVCVLGVLARAQQEEALLSRHFPMAYREYKRRTKALIPFVF